MINYPEIILIRHGETKWNLEGRFQGRLDSPLTERGELQARENGIKLKKYIKDYENIKIFSSPLGRAKNTAFIISDVLGVEKETIIFDNRIIEFNYGIFEGKVREKMLKTEEFKKREANKWSYIIKNGESYAIVQNRVKDFLNSIKDEEKVIIIAHEMVNRTIRGVYCNLLNDKTLNLKQPNSVILYLKDREEFLLT